MLCPFSCHSTNSHTPLSAEKWRLHRVGLNPHGENNPPPPKNKNKNKSSGLLSAEKRNNGVEEGSTSGSDTIQLSGWNTSQRRRRLSCSWDVKEDDVETCQKGAEKLNHNTEWLSYCSAVRLLIQTDSWVFGWHTDRNQDTQWEHTPPKHAWKTVELDWIYSVFQLFLCFGG